MHRAEPLYRCDDVRAIDAAAIAVLGGDAFALMHRAGEAALAAIRRHWPRATRLLVVCGGGNNGGDGFVVARLARVAGLDVQLVSLDDGAGAGPAAARARREWLAAGGHCGGPGEPFAAPELIVDALFGIGLSRAPEGAAAALIDAINAAGVPVLALDVPSGVDAERGTLPGRAVRATRTLVFIAGKRGLCTGAARDATGAIELAPLEVPAAAQAGVAVAAWRLDAAYLPGRLPVRRADSHKGDFGHVLAVGGDLGYGGALRLCAQAALRVGAGLVSVLTHEAHRSALLAALPECMVVCSDHGELPVEPLRRATVLALGPGLGRERWGRDLLPRLLELDCPAVIDADALNLLAEQPRALPGRVLTPHPGEAARLLGMAAAADIQADRYAALERLVERYRCAVVLKGAGTLVGAPGQTTRVIDAGNPGMAGGGMGDVLTGVIAGLLAQHLDPFEAAVTGALLHAAAGDAAAADGGARGLLASDLFPPLRRLANLA
jgi:ADP-dependent NAD(P)H-hydrate dehydratase / NAD(P)H-hydrate epimerase